MKWLLATQETMVKQLATESDKSPVDFTRDASTQLGDPSNFTLKFSNIVKNVIMTPVAYHIVTCCAIVTII